MLFIKLFWQDQRNRYRTKEEVHPYMYEQEIEFMECSLSNCFVQKVALYISKEIVLSYETETVIVEFSS